MKIRRFISFNESVNNMDIYDFKRAVARDELDINEIKWGVDLFFKEGTYSKIEEYFNKNLYNKIDKLIYEYSDIKEIINIYIQDKIDFKVDHSLAIFSSDIDREHDNLSSTSFIRKELRIDYFKLKWLSILLYNILNTNTWTHFGNNEIRTTKDELYATSDKYKIFNTSYKDLNIVKNNTDLDYINKDIEKRLSYTLDDFMKKTYVGLIIDIGSFSQNKYKLDLDELDDLFRNDFERVIRKLLKPKKIHYEHNDSNNRNYNEGYDYTVKYIL
jgi:hypothetical protein